MPLIDTPKALKVFLALWMEINLFDLFMAIILGVILSPDLSTFSNDISETFHKVGTKKGHAPKKSISSAAD